MTMVKKRREKRKKRERRRSKAASLPVTSKKRAVVKSRKPKKKKTRAKFENIKSDVPISGVKTMAKRKGKKRRATASKGKKRSFVRGVGGGGIQKTLITGALMGGGAIAAAMISNKVLPATMDKRLKALLPFAAGVAIHQFIKNEMAHNMAYGMMALGTLFLARELVPNIGLSGENDVSIPQLPGTYQALIGENEFSGNDAFMGVPEEFGEDLEIMGVPESFGEEGAETDWKRKD